MADNPVFRRGASRWEDVAAVVAEALRPIVSELRGSIDYFRTNGRVLRPVVSQLRLTGGGCPYVVRQVELTPRAHQIVGDAGKQRRS
ncbi:hypothetical protein [Microbacterium amylolyticum]|uniref:Uncharacterized protein n=1 Tax=Microbacterium amylolyticum TaxID=936337 RepID=A0ABS4ZGL5_9MICO|nr:hypothetical protein [Microbacterium amylolyticum]MBP2436352.1 hypothetical protein [Microbacterium amylolyticum]